MLKFKKTPLFFMLLFVYSTQTLAIDFELIDQNGKKHQLADYKGKWVVLNYWATWCPPCRKEIPMLIDYNESRDDVEIFGINYEPGIEADKLDSFIDTYFINYPIIPITREMVKKFGQPQGLPMTIFISPQGMVTKKYTGMLNRTFLNRIMK